MAISPYEYMDKASIDTDLKCEYCNDPLIDPVSTPCKHTFCRTCIETKIKSNGGACAKPKCKSRSLTIEDLTPVTERIVLNMLDRLQVKCTGCGLTNIQRGNFEKHAKKMCPKATICCSAADIKCPWVGPSDQLKQHIAACAYEKIRPVLDDVIGENRHLKEQIQHVGEQCQHLHMTYIHDQQAVNDRLNSTVDRLLDELNNNQIKIKELQMEIRQLKEQVAQSKVQISELEVDSHRQKAETIRVDQRCNVNETQINHLADQIDFKTGTISYHNAQLEMSIAKCQPRSTIDLSKQQLVDRDMDIVANQAVIEKECRRLDLGDNLITSKGASILADALVQNTTLEELDFHNNRVSDTGVHSLAQVLSVNDSILKALGLGSNSITDKGAEHLAEMLKTNRTVTWLALAGNQITDRGVELLASVLAHQNSSLLVLSLHVNKLVSDVSVDSIIDMLEHNRSLKKLWMQECNLSEMGKARLRDAARAKPGFSLYM